MERKSRHALRENLSKAIHKTQKFPSIDPYKNVKLSNKETLLISINFLLKKSSIIVDVPTYFE
jgi:hypothetical protein